MTMPKQNQKRKKTDDVENKAERDPLTLIVGKQVMVKVVYAGEVLEIGPVIFNGFALNGMFMWLSNINQKHLFIKIANVVSVLENFLTIPSNVISIREPKDKPTASTL